MSTLMGFIWVIVGVFFIWCGALQIISSMLPHDTAMYMAEKHGAWMRENVFHLPPANGDNQ